MTAARLIWRAAGAPRRGVAVAAPCWWCGLACGGGAVPQSDAIRDSFPDVGACPASDVVLSPYDERVGSPSWMARRPEWERLVQVGYSIAGCPDVVEIHAGGAYVAAVCRALREFPGLYEAPLGGLGVGYRLQWYAARRKA